jgi:ligand-binding SRPBCC domain-containing protein
VRRFEISSKLEADAERVWAHSTSPEGINREFRPLLRMTFPPGGEFPPPDWAPGKTLFRSRLLFLGFLPVEYDDVGLVEFEPGKRFLERSKMMSQKVWEHERIVAVDGSGCTITDRIAFEPRVRFLAPVYELVFRGTFRLRHHNLGRIFGNRA